MSRIKVVSYIPSLNQIWQWWCMCYTQHLVIVMANGQMMNFAEQSMKRCIALTSDWSVQSEDITVISAQLCLATLNRSSCTLLFAFSCKVVILSRVDSMGKQASLNSVCFCLFVKHCEDNQQTADESHGEEETARSVTRTQICSPKTGSDVLCVMS